MKEKILQLALLLITLSPSLANAQCSDLFFSEYIEGSSSNKALEVYNPSSGSINLSDYVIYRANNGSLTPTDSIFPQGVLASDSSYVIANPSANAAILLQADTTHTLCFYNGDDAVYMKKISTGDTLDIIGIVGVDPGSGWVVGTGATNNTTLIRKMSVLDGQLNWSIGATEWDVFPIDMVDSLGAHSKMACPLPDIVITEISYNGPEQGTDSTEFIELYNNGSSAVDMTGYSFTSGVTYTFPSFMLNSGAVVVIAVDSVAINNVFGVAARQWHGGGLSNGGESITLKDNNGILIDTLRYDDNSPWPGGGTAAGSPDGGGATIELSDVNLDNIVGSNWIASTTALTGVIVNTKQVYGSPGVIPSSSSGLTLSVSLDSTVSCNGFSNGGATVAVSGGTTPYTYAWSNAATTESITGVGAAQYFVTVTDMTGTSAIDSVSITEPALLVAVQVVDSNVACNGLFSGGASASATGGTMPYTYAWSNAATTASITGVGAASYSVTITDNNACSDNSMVTITEPLAVVSAILVDSNVSVNGGTDGGATASATGGIMPYTYLWSNAATTASITGVSAATYSVTITDNNGCSDTELVSITQPTLIFLSALIDSNVTCNGFLNGGATVSVTGGTMPYTYAWSNAATTASITGVGAATYTVTVTDNSGSTSTTMATITEPTLLVAGAIVDSNVSVNGGTDGGATASATGGTMSYTYIWSNAATTVSITGVMAGTYTVTITDNNACSDITSVNITQPASIVLSGVITDVSCNGIADGSIDLTVMNGSMPYTYLWSNAAVTEDISVLAAGTYTVTVTDAAMATATANYTISQPSPINIMVTVDSNVTCNGLANGGLSAIATGGIGSLSYAWNAGNKSLAGQSFESMATDNWPFVMNPSTYNTEGDSIVSGSDDVWGVIEKFTGNIDTASNGLYFWGIQDIDNANGGGSFYHTLSFSPRNISAEVGVKLSFDYYSVGFDSSDSLEYQVKFDNGTDWDTNGVALNKNTGAWRMIEVNIPDTANFVRIRLQAKQNGASDYAAFDNVKLFTSSNSVTGLAAGTYNVVVTDNLGCISTAAGTITEPTALTSSIIVTDASTIGGSDGSLDLTAGGGIPVYTYAWSNMAITEDIASLAAGTYTVTISDANNCSLLDSARVNDPAAVLVSTSGTDVSCNGGNDGTATALASGGTTPFTYLWSNTQTNSTATSLSAGQYFVTVTDNIGTSTVDSITITEPTVLNIASIVTNTSTPATADGSISLTVTGGTTPYTFSWSPVMATGSMINNLVAGTYCVTITDALGCDSVLCETVFSPGTIANLVISEINYNGPEFGTDTSEFIEFVNVGSTTVNLDAYNFSQGVTHTFGANDSITAGQFFVIAFDSSSFRGRYGIDADAVWTSGGLSNGGEDITIVDNFGRTVDSVDFDDSSPWPSGGAAGQADGGGASIELRYASLNNNDGVNWMASTSPVVGQLVNGFQVYGTPGAGPVIVGLSENDAVGNNLSIYPNPSKGIFTIETKTEVTNTRFQIIPMDGKIIRDEVLNQSKVNIDMSDYSNGVYFLRVGNATKKLILNR
ncbi:MAG: lamin tail domain-containing protein [Flavobacteriales bacterium]|nr:lamin tail domain-containing protein [Flavobacteriales bacterium]